MESGGDPTAAIEKLRDRNLGLGGAAACFGSWTSADYTDKPLWWRHRLPVHFCECVKARAKLLKSSFLVPLIDQNFPVRHELAPPPGWPQRYFAARKYGI
ncbi:MAG: hypothetical protein ACLT4C_10305 [Butyricicoccus sp.]